MNSKNKSLFQKTTDTENGLINLINSSDLIITITGKENPDNIDISNYMSEHPGSSISLECGRTWILVGKKGDKTESLNVGQAQMSHFEGEIIGNCHRLLGNCEKPEEDDYYNLMKTYDEVSFYEIRIDDYLEQESQENELELKDIAYELVKDYFAEVLVAHNTAAKHWWFYGSGMDKRFLFYLKEKTKGKFTFDASKKEK